MREFLRLTVAGAVSITGRILWRRYAEQLTGSRDVLGAPTIGEESVVTDTVEPVGQHMDQEAADELVGAERHELVAGVELGPVIFPFEGHALAVEGDEPAVSNSDPPERSGPFRGQRLLRCGSSRDSPLEGAGFEPSVPHDTAKVSGPTHIVVRRSLKSPAARSTKAPVRTDVTYFAPLPAPLPFAGSFLTLPWRELDSNFQFRKEQDGFPGRATLLSRSCRESGECRLKGEGRDKRRASAQADRPFRASTCCKKRIEVLRMPASPSGRRFKCGPVAAARVRNTVSAAGNGRLATDGTRRSGEMCKPDPTRQSVCASTLDGERGVMNSFRRKVRIDPSEAGTLPCT
jgi:hypothetical protein